MTITIRLVNFIGGGQSMGYMVGSHLQRYLCERFIFVWQQRKKKQKIQFSLVSRKTAGWFFLVTPFLCKAILTEIRNGLKLRENNPHLIELSWRAAAYRGEASSSRGLQIMYTRPRESPPFFWAKDGFYSSKQFISLPTLNDFPS